MPRFDGPRRLAEHRTITKLGRKLEQLRFELRVEAPRRTLDYLLEHIADLLEQMGDSRLRAEYAGQVERARELVAGRHNLRPVRKWSEYPKDMLAKCKSGAQLEAMMHGEWDLCDLGDDAS